MTQLDPNPQQNQACTHRWPQDDQTHLWGPWHHLRGLPHPVSYRTCVHPRCRAFEERAGAKA